jgi:hypothetical protein
MLPAVVDLGTPFGNTPVLNTEQLINVPARRT